ncbi:hypothetical protein EJ110_NYTH08791 [Nymphaea thermarum]|nr:hypothetical protein EJ110_NYTH08791 [Nymphaea thermarum]
MQDANIGYGDPYEHKGSKGEDVELEEEDVELEEEDVGVSLRHHAYRQLETTSMRKDHTQYDPINIDHFDILDSWVEEEPYAILDEDDLDFLNLEGQVEIIEEGEVGEQWNVGDIPFPTKGIAALNEIRNDKVHGL